MPNWCENRILVEGEEHHRHEFVDKNKGFDAYDTDKTDYRDLSFDAMIPIPRNKLKGEGWYDFCCDNWGTKWNAREPEVDHNIKYTEYTFQTAWCFPNIWLEKVSRKFKQLIFKVTWAEEGGEGGWFAMSNGKYLEEKRMTEDQWKEVIGYEDE